jgi:hypothetical protein
MRKALAFLRSSVVEHLFVHIENSTSAWSAWNQFRKIFDTPPASQRVDLQMKLLRKRLVDGDDVLEYISRIKNIHQDIIKGGFPKLEDNFFISILINGLPPSYKHFIETLQITDKLSTATFDSLSELLAQHSKSFGKQKQSGEDLLFTSSNKARKFKRKRSFDQ